MNDSMLQALTELADRRNLSVDSAEHVMSELMDGRCSDVEIAAFLTALRVKGETVEELTGAARAMRARVTRIPTSKEGLLDTCGTGGSGLHTFNISTAVAFVTAACGVPVAKHGNRGISSCSGSADVLEALGVNVTVSPEIVADCIEEIGLGFCYAPALHPAMKHAAPVRRQLRFRTLFNLLGPLTNPAGAPFQLVGTNRVTTAEKLAGTLAALGREHALVVCGNSELDEVCLWGETTVYEVEEGRSRSATWTAATFGLAECTAADLRVESAEESAAVVRRVFAGEPGPTRDIVLANSAAALLAARQANDVTEAVARAAHAIDSGDVQVLMDRLVAATNR